MESIVLRSTRFRAHPGSLTELMAQASKVGSSSAPQKRNAKFLFQLEPEGLGKLPLLLVEGIEAVYTQFEGCRHVQ